MKKGTSVFCSSNVDLHESNAVCGKNKYQPRLGINLVKSMEKMCNNGQTLYFNIF